MRDIERKISGRRAEECIHITTKTSDEYDASLHNESALGGPVDTTTTDIYKNKDGSSLRVQNRGDADGRITLATYRVRPDARTLAEIIWT